MILGDYIRAIDERNHDLTVQELLGISMTKEFRQSTSNIIGTDLSKYKIVRPGIFAFDTMSVIRVHKVPIVLNKFDHPIIISPAYKTFEIIDTETLSPYFLDLWFKRPEFDRYGDFKSDAAVRGGYNWEELCETPIHLPPIAEQRRIVNEYQTVERRIKNNEAMIQKLEETAQAIYHHTFVEGIDENNLPEGWRSGSIGDLGNVIGGATPSTDNEEYWVKDGISWLSPADMPRGVMYIDKTVKHITKEAYNSASTKMLPIGTVLFSSRAPIGLTAISDIELCTNQGYKSVVPFKHIGSYYVYFTLMNEKEKIANQQEGSTFAEISGKELAAYPAVIPAIDIIDKFNATVAPICNFRKNIERELTHLRTLQSLLTSKLA